MDWKHEFSWAGAWMQHWHQPVTWPLSTQGLCVMLHSLTHSQRFLHSSLTSSLLSQHFFSSCSSASFRLKHSVCERLHKKIERRNTRCDGGTELPVTVSLPVGRLCPLWPLTSDVLQIHSFIFSSHQHAMWLKTPTNTNLRSHEMFHVDLDCSTGSAAEPPRDTRLHCFDTVATVTTSPPKLSGLSDLTLCGFVSDRTVRNSCSALIQVCTVWWSINASLPVYFTVCGKSEKIWGLKPANQDVGLTLLH